MIHAEPQACNIECATVSTPVDLGLHTLSHTVVHHFHMHLITAQVIVNALDNALGLPLISQHVQIVVDLMLLESIKSDEVVMLGHLFWVVQGYVKAKLPEQEHWKP